MSNQDLREQLVNEQRTGTFAEVQLSAERVSTLHGILFDLDPELYDPSNTLFRPDKDPKIFFQNITSLLDRHFLAGTAEVRASGTGLHVIVRLDPPVQLTSAAERRFWAGVVGAAQATLPVDPNAPGLTALTRSVGSVNSKNGAVVELLRPAGSVTPRQVLEFLERVARAPFKEVASVLLGGQHLKPCPVCRAEGSRLDVLDQVGMCYLCGKVRLGQLLDAIYAPIPRAGEQEAAARAPGAEPGARPDTPAGPKAGRKRKARAGERRRRPNAKPPAG
jgi:hypothetical protein